LMPKDLPRTPSARFAALAVFLAAASACSQNLVTPAPLALHSESTQRFPSSGQPRMVTVGGQVIDIDDDATRLIGKDRSPGQNPLLLVRVELSEPQIESAEVVIVQAVDGGVACGQTRTEEEAARREWETAFKIGDRARFELTAEDDDICGRLRP